MMEQEMYFHSQGVQLAGTLTLPENPRAACLLICGSFPQLRDGDIDNSHTDWFPQPFPRRGLFRDEAQILAELGIASLRYDKRGCGQSEGDFKRTALLDLVDDARRGFEALQKRPELHNKPIGVLGQSEGAVVASMLAARESQVAFYVWQGGIYQSLDRILQWQARNFWQSEPEAIQAMQTHYPLIYYLYKQSEALIEAMQQGQESFRLGDAHWAVDYPLQGLREHFEQPQSQVLPQIHCPTLILHGALDHNTPPTEAEQAYKAMCAAGNQAVKLHIFAGLDHSFRRLGSRPEDFVTAMGLPLDPAMPKVLKAWLQSCLEL